MDSNQFEVGAKVRFIAPWDIFSEDTLIAEGQTGVIVGTENGTQLLGVKMNEHYPNLGDWQNVVWLDSELVPFAEVIEPANQ